MARTMAGSGSVGDSAAECRESPVAQPGLEVLYITASQVDPVVARQGSLSPERLGLAVQDRSSGLVPALELTGVGGRYRDLDLFPGRRWLASRPPELT
jgi:hypothetical protein